MHVFWVLFGVESKENKIKIVLLLYLILGEQNFTLAPSPYGRACRKSRSALVYLAADTIFIDLVIFWMFLTDLRRIEMVLRVAIPLACWCPLQQTLIHHKLYFSLGKVDYLLRWCKSHQVDFFQFKILILVKQNKNYSNWTSIFQSPNSV